VPSRLVRVPYTVTYTSTTKFTSGTPKKLKKGLRVTVAGTLKGTTFVATKVVL
jgi:Domain of unknown function (DUF5666)